MLCINLSFPCQLKQTAPRKDSLWASMSFRASEDFMLSVLLSLCPLCFGGRFHYADVQDLIRVGVGHSLYQGVICLGEGRSYISSSSSTTASASAAA
jgi:hypothetical protein